MTQDDPICSTCGERKSAHIATEKGPLTHPREARGEGTYVLVRGAYTSGAFRPGDADYEVPPLYKFVPTEPKASA